MDVFLQSALGEVSSEHPEVLVLFILQMKNLRFITERPEPKNEEWMDAWNKLENLQVIISDKYL
jgi:hypothetical protein